MLAEKVAVRSGGWRSRGYRCGRRRAGSSHSDHAQRRSSFSAGAGDLQAVACRRAPPSGPACRAPGARGRRRQRRRRPSARVACASTSPPPPPRTPPAGARRVLRRPPPSVACAADVGPVATPFFFFFFFFSPPLVQFSIRRIDRAVDLRRVGRERPFGARRTNLVGRITPADEGADLAGDRPRGMYFCCTCVDGAGVSLDFFRNSMQLSGSPARL